MGKGGKGKFKAPKEYKTDFKYLVVVNAWGTYGHPRFFDNVSAWFELMLKDDYPDERVRSIYAQSTHRNIIVELNPAVDILPLLGAHHYASFLKEPYNNSDSVSYIYEYNYARFNDPQLTGWSSNPIGSYDVTIFPIRQPYPIPLPAPPPTVDIRYAKRPPGVPVISPQANPPPRALDAHSNFNATAPSNTQIQDTQAPLPPFKSEEEDSEARLLVKKRDPYEEDDDADRLLRGAAGSSSAGIINQSEASRDAISRIVKREPERERVAPRHVLLSARDTVAPGRNQENSATRTADPVKHEETSVDEFLDSVPLVKKEEPTSLSLYLHSPGAPNEQTYEPSDSLVASYAQLAEKKPHIYPGTDTPEQTYEPSESLLTAYAQLVDAKPHIYFTDPAVASHSGADDQTTYEPSADLLAAFAGLDPERLRNPVGVSPHFSNIKEEVQTDSFDDNRLRKRSTPLTAETDSAAPPIPTISIKPETLDAFRLPPTSPSHATRDPRLLRRDRSATLASQAESAVTVRVKPEPLDDPTIPAASLLPSTAPRGPRLHPANGYAKRMVDDEDCRGSTKRIKSEYSY